MNSPTPSDDTRPPGFFRIGSALRTLSREFPECRLPELEAALRGMGDQCGPAAPAASRLDAARLVLRAWRRSRSDDAASPSALAVLPRSSREE